MLFIKAFEVDRRGEKAPRRHATAATEAAFLFFKYDLALSGRQLQKLFNACSNLFCFVVAEVYSRVTFSCSE